jgi:hypothetical protein
VLEEPSSGLVEPAPEVVTPVAVVSVEEKLELPAPSSLVVLAALT